MLYLGYRFSKISYHSDSWLDSTNIRMSMENRKFFRCAFGISLGNLIARQEIMNLMPLCSIVLQYIPHQTFAYKLLGVILYVHYNFAYHLICHRIYHNLFYATRIHFLNFSWHRQWYGKDWDMQFSDPSMPLAMVWKGKNCIWVV